MAVAFRGMLQGIIVRFRFEQSMATPLHAQRAQSAGVLVQYASENDVKSGHNHSYRAHFM